MNEEEIKEGWELENLVDIKYHLEKWKNESEKGELDECHLVEEDIEIMELAVNIIEKQQKEIEELKEINKEHQLLNGALGFKIGTLESEIEELKSNKKVFANINIELDDMKEYIDGAINNILIENYIPKQKITDKVIEIKDKKVKDMFITSSQGKLDTIIALESLLENEDIEKHIPRID